MPSELTAVIAAFEGVGLIALLFFFWRRADNERAALLQKLITHLEKAAEAAPQPPLPRPPEDDFPVIP